MTNTDVKAGFESYLKRHSECFVQFLIETIEANENVRAGDDVTLEDRWIALMGHDRPRERAVA